MNRVLILLLRLTVVSFGLLLAGSGAFCTLSVGMANGLVLAISVISLVLGGYIVYLTATSSFWSSSDSDQDHKPPQS